MYCTKCGAKLEPNERFCPFCGEVVDDSPEQPPAPPPAPSPEPQSPLPQPPIPDPDPDKRPIDKKLIAVAAVAAVAVLAIIAAAIFLLGGKGKPDDTAVSPSPGLSVDPSGEPTESSLPSEPSDTEEPSLDPASEPSDGVPPSQPSETSEPPQNSVSLSDLYIGAWAAEGCTIDDYTNGWMALYVESTNGNVMTFTLEKVQSGPANRIAITYPITVTISDGKGTFPVNDSWGNSGTGTITVKGNAIHVTVDITSPDMTAMWDIMMDEDFYPANASSGQQNQATQITVKVNGSALSLSQAPYLNGGQVIIPMEPVFKAMGIAVFEDDGMTVALTESHAVTLTDMEGYILDVAGMGTDWGRSDLVRYSNGCLYVPLNTLNVFGLQTSWDSAGKVAAIQGTIATSDRTSAQKVEALKGFDMDEAGQRVQNAGYTFAAAGAERGYGGGNKYWAIPVQTANGIQYAIVSYDGASYQMTVEPAEY